MFVIALLILLSAPFGLPTAGHYEERAQGRGTQKPAPAPTPPTRSGFFTSTLPEAELRNKQAVLDTTLGTIVIDLLPDAAPNHVAHFITRAREGAYDGTTFHRVVTNGIIQGGDPLSKDPGQAAKYGTGGLNELRFEANREKHTRGAVSAVLVPGNRDSAGSQFFISVTDQPALDGQYSVFGQVTKGMDVADKIVSAKTGGQDRPLQPTSIEKIVIREATADEKGPTPK